MLTSRIGPYLAVITDSFRAAMASRVLWAAMLAIWILLAALAPLGTREDYTTTFRSFDLYNGTRMKALLAQGMVDPAQADKPLGRLAKAMPEELRQKLQRVGEGEQLGIPVRELIGGLNALLDQDSGTDNPDAASTVSNSNDPESAVAEPWFDGAAWKDTVRLRELRELDATPTEELDDSLRRRRARLRLEAALPGVFEARSSRSVVLMYGTLDFPSGLEIDRAMFETIFNQFVIPTIVHWLLGFVLVFLGVLVTASIIPDMLQPGSLHLLLSKPISRPGLLTAKFVGGCAFVLLCVAQLVLGLYLIAGWRLGIWNPRILYCVPVSIILFGVFFSVSVPAGLKWRSPIISIAAAGALAALCVVVGVIGGIFEARVRQPDQIQSVLVVGDDWIASTGGSGLVRYDRDGNRWRSLIASEAISSDRVLAPVKLDDDTLLTARVRGGRFNPFGTGTLDLIALTRGDDWAIQPSLRLPNATETLVRLPGGKLLTINTADLLTTDDDTIRRDLGIESTRRLDDESNSEETKSSQAPRVAGGLGSWLKALTTLQGGATEEFTSILPRGVTLSPPTRIAVGSPGQLFVRSMDRVYRLSQPADGESTAAWNISARHNIERTESELDAKKSPVFLAASSKWVLLGRGDPAMVLLDADDLSRRAVIELPDDITPLRLLPLGPLGDEFANQFIAITTQGDAVTVTVADDGASIAWSEPMPFDDVRTVTVDADSRTLLIAHDVDSLAVAKLDNSQSAESPVFEFLSPRLSMWRMVDKYVLGTIQLFIPRVLELGDTTSAMVSGEQSFVMQPRESGEAEVVRYRAAGPLVSCVLFIAVMLAMSCWMFSRTDF